MRGLFYAIFGRIEIFFKIFNSYYCFSENLIVTLIHQFKQKRFKDENETQTNEHVNQHEIRSFKINL